MERSNKAVSLPTKAGLHLLRFGGKEIETTAATFITGVEPSPVDSGEVLRVGGWVARGKGGGGGRGARGNVCAVNRKELLDCCGGIYPTRSNSNKDKGRKEKRRRRRNEERKKDM